MLVYLKLHTSRDRAIPESDLCLATPYLHYMSLSPVDSLTRQTATHLISLYQTRISPHKGFACAYRVLYGSESCSQYIKRTIQAYGVWQSLPLIRERFQDCKNANQRLKHRSQAQSHPQFAAIGVEQASPDDPLAGNTPPETLDPNSPNAKNDTGQSAAPNSGSGLDCSGCEVLECADCSGLDCDFLGGSHQCTAMECGALDCDCGALDCGSCSW